MKLGLKSLRHFPLAGGLIISCFLIAAVLAPFLATHDPVTQDLAHTLAPPAWQQGGDASHLLGTDNLGRTYTAAFSTEPGYPFWWGFWPCSCP